MPSFSYQIQQRVADFIAAQELLPAVSASVGSTPLYVALSGGPDSVALLHILHSLGYACHALHCNFHLRGAESDRDEQFCHDLCAQLSVPLTVRQFDTRQYMADHHLSLEMAARELRYEWWSEVVRSSGCEVMRSSGCEGVRIALGHHADDSIETLLMNLMRGTGIHGLTGIVARNEASHVIRPLLCLSRQEILSYLADVGLSYVTDSTNAECDTLRNQIRHQLLPLMEQLVPQCRQGIQQTISHLQDTELFANTYLAEFDWMTRHYEAWGIEWDELSKSDLRHEFGDQRDSFLHEWEAQHCDRESQRLCHDSQIYYTAPLDPAVLDLRQPKLQEIEYEIFEPLVENELFHETFDADTITPPLSLRRWREGDRIAPLGMNGHSKLVSDLMHDAHYSPMQKATTWLVADATGAILWVIGLRMSDKHKVSPHTQHLLRLSVSRL